MSNIWQRVMAMKKYDNRHIDIANDLKRDEIETILGTVDYFGGNV